MAFEDIKENINDIPQQVEEIYNSSVEYYKLLLFRFIANSASIFLKVFALGALLMLMLFFLFIAVAFALGNFWANNALGFLCVSILFGLSVVVVYVFREVLISKPLLSKLSQFYFNEQNDKEEFDNLNEK